jgi:hypothetical protein
LTIERESDKGEEHSLQPLIRLRLMSENAPRSSNGRDVGSFIGNDLSRIPGKLAFFKDEQMYSERLLLHP